MSHTIFCCNLSAAGAARAWVPVGRARGAIRELQQEVNQARLHWDGSRKLCKTRSLGVCDRGRGHGLGPEEACARKCLAVSKEGIR